MDAQLIRSLEHRLRILEDKDAITTLLNTYCDGADAGDPALISKVFAVNGQLSADWVGIITGRETLTKGISEGGRAFGHLMHSISNVQINVDGSDQATGAAYLSFYAVKDASRLAANYAFGGPYRFKFVKEDDTWKILSVEIDRWWEQGKDDTGAFKGGNP